MEHVSLMALKEMDPNDVLESKKERLHHLEESLIELCELTEDLNELIRDQGMQLEEAKENIEQIVEDVEEGVAGLRTSARLAAHNRRLTWYPLGGATMGGAIGASGFFLGPIVGAVTTVASSALGFGVGTYATT